MWLTDQQSKKWRSDSLEARIYAIAEAEAHANDRNDGEAAAEGIEAVYQVMGWLASNKQKDVVEMIKERFGVETSPAALSGFHSRFKAAWHGERLRRSARTATDLANIVTPEEEARIKSQFWLDVRQAAFELMTNPNPDPKDYVDLAQVLLKKDAQDLSREKFEELKAAKRERDEAKEVVNSQLTPEEQNRRLREILK